MSVPPTPSLASSESYLSDSEPEADCVPGSLRHPPRWQLVVDVRRPHRRHIGGARSPHDLCGSLASATTCSAEDQLPPGARAPAPEGLAGQRYTLNLRCACLQPRRTRCLPHRHRPGSPRLRLRGLAEPRDRGHARRHGRGRRLAAPERPREHGRRRDLGEHPPRRRRRNRVLTACRDGGRRRRFRARRPEAGAGPHHGSGTVERSIRTVLSRSLFVEVFNS